MELIAHRQPILGKSGEVFAYEFTVSQAQDTGLPPDILENKLAVITMRNLAEYGIKKVGDGKRVFVKAPLDALLIKAHELLAPQLLGLKLSPAKVGTGKTVYSKAMALIEKLKMEEVVVASSYELVRQHPDILQHSDIVEFDIHEADDKSIQKIKVVGLKVLVSGIENGEKVPQDADLLQGSSVAPAEELKRIKIAPYLKSTLLRLLVLMNTAETPAEFAKVIETDIGLSAKLLRFVNSAYFALRKSIKSIEQATVYFGLKNIKNFILVLAMNDYASVENPVLWRKALIRAKVMEELAKLLIPERESEAYLVGLFSLLGELLEVDVPDFLVEVNVDEFVVSAFRDKDNPLAKLLEASIVLEGQEDYIKEAKKAEDVKPLISVSESLKVSPDEVLEIAKKSYTFADTIIHL